MSWNRDRTGILGIILGCLVLALATTPAAAQAPATGGAQEGAEEYRVGEGDVLRVDVAGRNDLTGNFTVSPAGTIQVPIIGAVQVSGRTTAEIRSDLSRRISLFDRTSPQVTVGIAEYKSKKIFVLGAVLLPGIYAFADMPNAWEAIAEAGGPVEDADLAKVEVIPGDSSGGRKTETVDVATAIRESRADLLPKLRPGDTVRVPRGVSSTTVLLMGAVLRPGPQPIDQARDLVSALARAGGPSNDAKLSRIEIVRVRGADRSKMRVNLESYFSSADVTGNPRLESGDTVFIPRAGGRNPLIVIGAISTVVGLVSSILAIANN